MGNNLMCKLSNKSQERKKASKQGGRQRAESMRRIAEGDGDLVA